MPKPSKIDQLRLQWRSLRFETWDSFRDAIALFVPIFVVVGMILVSWKLWTWILF